MTKYSICDLVKNLNLEYENETFKAFDREISVPAVSRVGLELTGFQEMYNSKRIMVLGKRELAYIETMSTQSVEDVFSFLLQEDTPCIIVSRGYNAPKVVLSLAMQRKIPILKWSGSTTRLLLSLYAILDEWFAPRMMISGTLMQIHGKGILIQGPSGIGKSEIALELMNKGHNLVSDDSVEVLLFDNRLQGRAPRLIKNMIEIRGVGILDVTELFGHAIISDQVRIDYIIELSKWDKKLTYERVGNNRLSETLFGVEIEKIILPVSEGRSMADVIEVSVTNFKLQEKGINVSEEFEKRIERELLEEE